MASDIAKTAKIAFEQAQLIPSTERIAALHAIKAELSSQKEQILDANKKDIQAAQIERLDLGKGDKWDSMLQGIVDVAALPDPTGNVTYASELDDELELYAFRVPLVSCWSSLRPARSRCEHRGLGYKSGNAAILKGGKESNNTTQLLSKAISAGLARTSLPEAYVQTIQTRAEVSSLLGLDQYIDLVIPRGSNSLVRNIQNNTRIPVMGHADGLCTIYLDETADLEKAVRIVIDSKTDYPSACNAAETLIIHESLLNNVWPSVAKALLAADVKLQCDPRTLASLGSISPPPNNLQSHVRPSDDASFSTEHLSLTISVTSVPSLQSAIQFINSHSSHHTDCIVTESDAAISAFCRGVDSAGTFVNASTRFADGFRYGFGTEVGISTGRIHARGPVGLEGLVTYKYMMRSKGKQGHIVGEFGVGKKQYKHNPIAATTVPF
ncbi:gamma-glutamyl phosphate reductase [Infundibulicybe gibba]|nr:gamma-glutamyl phosphate reductase [Infundibulicybe gibba]